MDEFQIAKKLFAMNSTASCTFLNPSTLSSGNSISNSLSTSTITSTYVISFKPISCQVELRVIYSGAFTSSCKEITLINRLVTFSYSNKRIISLRDLSNNQFSHSSIKFIYVGYNWISGFWLTPWLNYSFIFIY